MEILAITMAYNKNQMTNKKHPLKGDKIKPVKKRKYYEIRSGYRSGLEEQIQEALDSAGVAAQYEQEKIPFVIPAKNSKYLPDWRLPNGIIIEAKGRFVLADRQKHLLIKQQHPEEDIRFIFYNANAKLDKRSKTTQAEWAEKNGFKYSDWKTFKGVPEEWLVNCGA
jgi:hypothetical protein